MEDDVRKYLSEIPDYGDTIKIKHLLLHTSGIKDDLITFAGNMSEIGVTQDSLLKIVGAQKSLNFKPGEEMIYSNAGYDLLGIIVERASGKSLKEFAKDNIFLPLRMVNTEFSKTYEKVQNIDKAYGYKKFRGNKYKKIPTINNYYQVLGSTGLYSTVEDLILWQNNYEYNILGSQGQKIVEKMQTKGQLNKGEYNTSGYGLFINWHYGKLQIGHNGSTDGYTTDMETLSKEKLTVICLSNMLEGNSSFFVNSIFNIFYPPPANFNRFDFSSVPLTTTKYMIQKAKLEEGVFYDSLHKKVKIISVKNDTLLSIDYPGFWPAKYLPLDSTTFKYIYTYGNYVFKESTKGKFIEENKSDKIYYKMATPNKKLNQNYIGTYKCDELGSQLKVLERRGKLFVLLGKEINTALEPLFLNGFSVPAYKEIKALVIFQSDSNEKVKGVSINIERARNIYFKKTQ